MKFELYEDCLEKVWYRRYYDIEADNIEEAVKLIRDNQVFSNDSKLLEFESGEPEYREIMYNDEILYKG